MANQVHCDKCRAETDRVFSGIGLPDGEYHCEECIRKAGLEPTYARLINYHLVDNGDATRKRIVEMQQAKKLEKHAKWIERKRGPEAAARYLEEHAA